MSSPANTSPQGREASVNGSATSNVDDKPRLSEHEKKANHIASGELPILHPAVRAIAQSRHMRLLDQRNS